MRKKVTQELEDSTNHSIFSYKTLLISTVSRLRHSIHPIYRALHSYGPKITLIGGWQWKCSMELELSLWLLVTILVPEFCYLTSDEISHMGLNKHVCWIKHVHDEPLWCRHRGIQIDNELCHWYITAGGGKKWQESGLFETISKGAKNKSNDTFSWIKNLPGDKQALDCIDHFLWALDKRKLPDGQT